MWTRQPALELYKRFEDRFELILWDADAGVAHADPRLVAIVPTRHLDLSPGASGLDGVGEKVEKNLLHFETIAERDDARCLVRSPQLETFGPRLGCDHGDDRLHEGRKRDRPTIVRDLSDFDSTEVENVIDDIQEMRLAALNAFQVLHL